MQRQIESRRSSTDYEHPLSLEPIWVPEIVTVVYETREQLLP